jgi:hypothetical protein
MERNVLRLQLAESGRIVCGLRSTWTVGHRPVVEIQGSPFKDSRWATGRLSMRPRKRRACLH